MAMTINEIQVARLDEILELATTHSDELTQWEQEFLDDIRERYSRYADTLQLSSRQWDVLERCLDKMERSFR